MTSESAIEGPAPANVLARDVGEFLIELAMALEKYGVYPPGHPVLARVSDRLMDRLEALLEARPALSLGVARTQLVIEGLATDASHPVLRQLALRFHEHQLAVLRLRRGVEEWELAELLRALAGVRTGGRVEPIGLRDPLPEWPHMQLSPLGFEDLAIVDAGAGDSTAASRLWVDLARAALAGERTAAGEGEADGEEGSDLSPSVVARAIDRRSGQATYDQVIAGYLIEVAHTVGFGEKAEAAPLTNRVARLVKELNPETLRRLMAHGGDRGQQRDFMRAAATGLPVDTVVRLLAATAEADSRPLSESLLRMYEKMAMHAEAEGPSGPGRAQNELRTQVQALVSGWELEDPAPDRYGLALSDMARTQRTAGPGVDLEAIDPERLLEMCLELDSGGTVLEHAVDRLVEAGRAGAVLDLLDYSGGSSAARAAFSCVARVDRLPQLLVSSDLTPYRLVPLLERMGEPGLEALLDMLLSSEDPAIRRPAFDLLVALGPTMAAAVDARLVGETRWYAIRNLLALHDAMDTWPAVDLEKLSGHADGRVRREALKLLLKDPDRRAAALLGVLQDEEPRVLQLVRGTEDVVLPDGALPVLARRLQDEQNEAIRPALARLLAPFRSEEARDLLLGLAVRGRTLLGRPKLEPATPAGVAALEVLARHWRHDNTTLAVLNHAAGASDPAVRAAAATRSRE